MDDKILEEHDNAMKDLIDSGIDKETDFTTWLNRFKAKEAIQQAKDDVQQVVKECPVSSASASASASSQCGRSFYSRCCSSSAMSSSSSTKSISVGIKNPFIRMEIYSPPEVLEKEAKKRGLKFTVGREYPIYAEMLENNFVGMRYITKDDEGNRRSVNSFHFNPPENLTWYELVE